MWMVEDALANIVALAIALGIVLQTAMDPSWLKRQSWSVWVVLAVVLLGCVVVMAMRGWRNSIP